MNQRKINQIAAFAFLVAMAALPAFAGGTRDRAPTAGDRPVSVLVYVTGMLAGSPTYELMAEGAENFAATHRNVTIKVYEAGFNQAEWEEQLTSLVASGEYDLVLGSNPSLPELCVNVSNRFPNQKFIILDAELEGHPQIATYLYNQYEQSLYLGYLAGLITTSAMAHANPARKIGFIAAQEYPLLNNHIVPGFLKGAQMVDPTITLDFRIIGNWFDANKAADLASSMITADVDVFAAIAGGAAQGLFRTAQEQGAYVVFHNTNEYAIAPGTIVGCGYIETKKLVEDLLADFLAGNVTYGTSKTVGISEGFLTFIADDPGYTDYLPQDIQDRFNAFLANLRAGNIEYTIPPL